MPLTQVTQKLRLKIQLIWKDLLGKICLFAIFLGFLFSDLRLGYLKAYGDVALSSELIWIDWGTRKVANFWFSKCQFFLFLVLKSCLPKAGGDGSKEPRNMLTVFPHIVYALE